MPQDEIIAKLVKRAEGEKWTTDQLHEEIWDAAVEWAGSLVDYSHG